MTSTAKTDDDLVAALVQWAIKAENKGSKDLAARLMQAAIRITEIETKKPPVTGRQKQTFLEYGETYKHYRRNSEDIHD